MKTTIQYIALAFIEICYMLCVAAVAIRLQNPHVLWWLLGVVFPIVPCFNEAKKEGKGDDLEELLSRAIDVSVPKDNGDGTERLFISIPQLGKIVKEMMGGRGR